MKTKAQLQQKAKMALSEAMSDMDVYILVGSSDANKKVIMASTGASLDADAKSFTESHPEFIAVYAYKLAKVYKNPLN